jgi:hypothetical protein
MNESTPPEDKRRPDPPTDEGASTGKRAGDDLTPRPEPAGAQPGDAEREEPASEDTASTSVGRVEQAGEPEEPVVDTDQGREEAVVAAPPARGGRGLAALALFVALAAAAGSAYVAWMTKLAAGQADTARADLSGDLGRLEAKSAALEESLRTIEREQRSGSEQVGRLSGIEGRLEGRIDALETRTAALARTESVPRAAAGEPADKPGKRSCRGEGGSRERGPSPRTARGSRHAAGAPTSRRRHPQPAIITATGRRGTGFAPGQPGPQGGVAAPRQPADR